MVYLESFRFPHRHDEESFFFSSRIPSFYNTKYPFNIFRYRELPEFEFDSVTIIYGSNGSGKSTILNVIAETLGIHHRTAFNKSTFFPDYINLCECSLAGICHGKIPEKSKIITSDDVFEQLIETRYINEKIDRDRDTLFSENIRISKQQREGFVYRMKSLNDYDELEKYYSVSKGKYMDRAERNIIEQSNGENAIKLFERMIENNALYLLDEPENSLAAEKQMDIRDFIFDSARFNGCQFIISTHSPFFLSTPHAKIYNIDMVPPRICDWTKLPNVRAYYNLFEQNRWKFIESKE